MVIRKTTPLEEVEKLGDGCTRCGHCCSFGSGYFLDEDIARIASKLNMRKKDFIKEFLEEKEVYNTKVHKSKIRNTSKPYGPCVFFSRADGCVIHEIKPLHCRVGMGCGRHGEEISHWFALNYLVDPDDPESVRQWALCLRYKDTIPGGRLHELVPDKEKLGKILNYGRLR